MTAVVWYSIYGAVIGVAIVRAMTVSKDDPHRKWWLVFWVCLVLEVVPYYLHSLLQMIPIVHP